ncbi:hypothetical protein AK812_SmicGene30326 [Symbiodinium microadriaticum]|uniref:Uncharacterized protein n=1 Tax=Symbiodinium microadriaticum TaxID=2951 RepID=A0A1Q9CZH3_SYMMI|nr:hypothetical protein AK812_SmicGene30326 [Symbiodinium microadriaticum]
MKSPGCASVVEAYAPTSLGLATAARAEGLSFSPQVQVPAVPALPTAGLLQALAPKRGVPPPVRGPAPLGVPKQQLEAMAKRLAMEAQVRGSGSSGFAERAQRRGNNPECFRKPEDVSRPVASYNQPRLSPLLEARWAVLAVSLYEGSGHFGSIVVEEQRYRGVPQSELERLDRIDPEVDEVL